MAFGDGDVSDVSDVKVYLGPVWYPSEAQIGGRYGFYHNQSMGLVLLQQS